MPIYRLLKEGTFDAGEADVMAAAYEAALRMAHLADRPDPITELIASKIIEVFRNGEHDPSKICARALKELGVSIPD